MAKRQLAESGRMGQRHALRKPVHVGRGVTCQSAGGSRQRGRRWSARAQRHACKQLAAGTTGCCAKQKGADGQPSRRSDNDLNAGMQWPHHAS